MIEQKTSQAQNDIWLISSFTQICSNSKQLTKALELKRLKSFPPLFEAAVLLNNFLLESTDAALSNHAAAVFIHPTYEDSYCITTMIRSVVELRWSMESLVAPID